MKNFELPYVSLPNEFVQLLKMNEAQSSQPAKIVEIFGQNKAMMLALELSLSEFDTGKKGLEKIFNVLGWANFRDRVASVFISKMIHGKYPTKTDVELIQEIKQIEMLYAGHGVNSFGTAFLLGFYLRMANIGISEKEGESKIITIPDDLLSILKLSQGKSERIDILILTLMHLYNFFGLKPLSYHIKSGLKFYKLYPMMSPDAREMMHDNLLVYAASIQESDLFLYQKV